MTAPTEPVEDQPSQDDDRLFDPFRVPQTDAAKKVVAAATQV